MRLARIWLVSLLLWLSPQAFALSYESGYYAVYERPTSGGTLIYIVPKRSILIVASDINIPIAFMPNVPSLWAIVGYDGKITSTGLSAANVTADYVAAIGATPSSYRLIGADFTGDGSQDLLLLGSGARESVILSAGSNDSPYKYYSFGTSLNGSQLSIADLNGDGRADILATAASGAQTSYLSSSLGYDAYGSWFENTDNSMTGYSSNLVGSINGKFRVSEQGEATYSVDLLAAQGTAGVAPHISLNYSSDAGDGIAGLGWSVGGLSSISRCHQTPAQDGNTSGVSLNANDRFCLDGQRLIVTSGTYGAAGSMYRTEIDSYAVITAVGGSTGNPEYFTVRRKDGSLSYYGAGNGSAQSVSPGSTDTRRLSWAISRFQDSVGNPIKFTYIDDVGGHRISRIDYAYGTNTGAAGNSGTYIEFLYQNRPDPRSAYVAGYQVKRTQRLSVIRTVGDNVELRNYHLQYRTANLLRPQSYVNQLYECVDKDCLTPTAFTWSTLQSENYQAVNVGGIPGSTTVRSMDINGDGKADIVYMGTASPYQLYYRVWQGTTFGPQMTLPAGLITDGNTNWGIIDFNNDGYQDLLVGSPGQNWKLFLGAGNGTLNPYNGSGDTGIPYYKDAAFIDLNGDGLVDIAYNNSNTDGQGDPKFRLTQRVASGGNWNYQFGAEQAFSISYSTPPGEQGYILANRLNFIPGETVDYNGDGKVDLSAFVATTRLTSGGGPYPGFSTTYRHAILSQDANGTYVVVNWGPVVPVTATNKPRTISIDLNNDGLLDLVTVSPDSTASNPTWTWRYALNTGNGFTGEVVLGSGTDFPDLQLVDYNRDGYPDLVYSSNNTMMVRLYSPLTQSFSSTVSTWLPFSGSTVDQYVFSDVDGDGRTDALRVSKEGSGNTLYLYRSVEAGAPINRITQIDNGLGNTTKITFKALTDTSVYTRASDANTSNWPNGAAKPNTVFDMAPPSYVVASVSSTAPVAGSSAGAVNYSATSSVGYRYSGAKLEAGGRGFLGFASITTTDNQSGVVTKTTYRQDFPFTGQPLSTEVKTAGGLVMKYSENQPISNTITALDGTRYYQPYIAKVTELNRDPVTGAEIGYVETISAAPDAWGNALSVTSSTFSPGGHSAFLTQSITSNTYGSTDYDQQFGRLTRTRVTHKRNCMDGCPDIVRTSAFSYYGSGDGVLQGLLKSETVEPDSAAAATTTYEYDGFGNKTRVTRSASGLADRYTQTTYDAAGRYAVSSSSPFSLAGGWTDQVTEEVLARNAYGAPITVRGLNGLVTEFSYDALGRETSRSDNTGALVTTEYSRVGLIAGAVYKVTSTTSSGASGTEYFDALGRSIAKTQAGFAAGSIISSETEYDSSSRVLRQSQPHYSDAPAYWSETTYDLFGRPTVQKTPASNGATAISSIQYDGLRVIYTNAAGQVRQEWRNGAGELIKVQDHVGGSVNFSYDAMGQLVVTTNLDSDSAQVSINSYLNYDRLGRKIKMVDSDKGTWFYQYNAFGELTEQYKAMSVHNYGGDLSQAIADGVQLQRTHMDYDRRGRMIARADYREDGSQEGTASWTYDTSVNGIGQMAAESGGGLTRLYTYDSRGRVSATNTVIDASPYVQAVTYDSVGRVDTQLDGATSSSGVRNAYNARGYLESVTDLDTTTPLYQVQDMDALGHVLTAVYGNGATSEWLYEDRTGLLLNQTVTVGMLTLQNLSYTWDVLGNQTSRRDQGLISESGNTYRDLKQSFCYDGLNRLIKTYQGALGGSCSIAPADQDQQYDAFGNITAKNGVGAYTYMVARPRTLASTGDGVSYTYDATGNLVSDTSGRILHYTVFDKPDQITKYNNQVAFAYGPDRSFYKRVDTDTSSGQSTTTYTVGALEKVVKSDGSYDVRRYLAGVALWTQHYVNGSPTSLDKQYLHKDVLGSVVLITDGVGVIKQQSAFDAWGERVDLADWQTVLPASIFLPVSAQFTNKGFTGHEMLDAVGLIHMQGRIYDAKIGRFVQADPVVQDASDTQAYNRYAYVRNNPLTLVDPSGFSWLGKAFKSVSRVLDPIGSRLHERTTERWLKNSATFRQAVGIVMAALDGWFCMGICSAAYAGYVTDLMGGSAWQGLSAAAFSFMGSQLTIGVNQAYGFANNAAINIVANGFVGGVMSTLQGGKFGSGFIAAGIGAGVGGGMAGAGWASGSTPLAVIARVGVAAVVGGTASEITGGKFGNGALYAAFAAALQEGVTRITGQTNLDDLDASASKVESENQAGVVSGPNKISRLQSGADITLPSDGSQDDLTTVGRLLQTDAVEVTVVAHGSPSVLQNGRSQDSGATMASVLRDIVQLKKATTVRVYACNAGQSPNGFAQQLSNSLGVTVIAPTNYINFRVNGGAVTYSIGDEGSNVWRGGWKAFCPGGKCR